MHRRLPHVALVLAAAAAVFVLWPFAEPAPDPAPDVGPAEIEAVPDVIRLRLVAKSRLAKEVAARRRPLLEAAALFAALDQVPPIAPAVQPDLDDTLIPIHAGTPEELSCWRVARWVHSLGPVERGTSPAVARLADEFRAELAARGVIHLPDEAGLEPAQSLLEGAREQCAAWARGTIKRSAATPRCGG